MVAAEWQVGVGTTLAVRAAGARFVIYAPPVISTRNVAALVASTLLLTGCGLSDIIDMAKDEADDPGPPPAGTQWVEVESEGIRFAVPESWSIVDPDGAEIRGRKFEEIAGALGVSSAQARAMLEQVEIYVFSTSPGENINVIDSPLSEVPTPAAIRASFKSLSATVRKISPVDTDAGDGQVAYYELRTPDATLYGGSVFVGLDDAVANITVTARSEAKARRLTRQLLPTIEASD